MKKRIISLILVLATAFLTLTGCAFNYAKSDMTKYADFDAAAFREALKNLTIKDGTFSNVEETRQLKVTDAIAAALLGITDDDDKKYEGALGNSDVLYYCYYATDADNNIFFAENMNESKVQKVQLGLSTLNDKGNELMKLIAEKVVTVGDIASYIYSASAANYVGSGDVISVSYFLTEGDSSEGKAEFNDYLVVNEAGDEFHKALIGKKVGETFSVPQFEVELKDNDGNATGETVKKTYSNVKVESILVDSDKGAPKLAEGNKVYVSYTVKFDPAKIKNEDGTFPVGYSASNVGTDGKYALKVTYEFVDGLVADPKNGENNTVADTDKTFLGQLIGKASGSLTESITIPAALIAGKNVGEATYSSISTVVVNKINNNFTVTHTPYDSKKEVANTYNNLIDLDDKELTYHIFPVYYVDVVDAENVTADVIIREFIDKVNSTKEHEHTEDEHEHEHSFASLNKDENGNEYKNGDKTLATLVGELADLVSKITEKEKTRDTALEALVKAQKAYGGYTGDSATDRNNLNKTMVDARKAYITAKTEVEKLELGEKNDDGSVKTAGVEDLVKQILECTKGESDLKADIVADYRTYNYDTLKASYKSEISKNLATEIVNYLGSKITFSNLPKRAVKSAYKSIMNTHKNTFYEGNYSSGVTNYSKYEGDFDAYLIATVAKSDSTVKTIEAAEDYVWAQAESTVKGIMMVYVLLDAVEAKWDGADVKVTKDEKKNLKDMVRLYEQIGYPVDYDTEYHAMQFDKIMNFLLEMKEEDDWAGLDVEFKNIGFSYTEATE